MICIYIYIYICISIYWNLSLDQSIEIWAWRSSEAFSQWKKKIVKNVSPALPVVTSRTQPNLGPCERVETGRKTGSFQPVTDYVLGVPISPWTCGIMWWPSDLRLGWLGQETRPQGAVQHQVPCRFSNSGVAKRHNLKDCRIKNPCWLSESPFDIQSSYYFISFCQNQLGISLHWQEFLRLGTKVSTHVRVGLSAMLSSLGLLHGWQAKLVKDIEELKKMV